MITSINEWRKLNSHRITENIIDNNIQPSIDPMPVPHADADTLNNIIKIGEYAKGLELSKGQTIDIVKTVFLDPAKAPDDISVAFVQDHLGEIISYIESLPDADFSTSNYQYTTDMESNALPFECVMYVPENDTIKKLTESLNKQIKKSNFKAVYENGIFFINSLENLNENNKTIVLNLLKENNAKNISKPLQWKRKIV